MKVLWASITAIAIVLIGIGLIVYDYRFSGRTGKHFPSVWSALLVVLLLAFMLFVGIWLLVPEE